MKLNMGCGFNHVDGYLNVDSEPLAQPDQLWDFEQTPWPWPDNSFSEVLAFHTLEHLGADTKTWLAIMKELWRVCENNALIRIAVPPYTHENFWHDPTHVRAVTPIGLAMFDQERNMNDLRAGGHETKLGLYCGIDFKVEKVEYDLHEPWLSQLRNGQISNEQMNFEFQTRNNISYQIRIEMRAVKPARAEALGYNQSLLKPIRRVEM